MARVEKTIMTKLQKRIFNALPLEGSISLMHLTMQIGGDDLCANEIHHCSEEMTLEVCKSSPAREDIIIGVPIHQIDMRWGRRWRPERSLMMQAYRRKVVDVATVKVTEGKRKGYKLLELECGHIIKRKMNASDQKTAFCNECCNTAAIDYT